MKVKIKLIEFDIEDLNRDFLLRTINRVHEELGDLENNGDLLIIRIGSLSFSKEVSFNAEDDLIGKRSGR